MYERKIASVIFVLMLVCAGQAVTDFPSCFATCIIGCALSPNKAVCAMKCLVKCIISNSPPSDKLNCKLGCAIDQCLQYGEDVDKVSGCVKKCEDEKCAAASSAVSRKSSDLNCKLECGIDQCLQFGDDVNKVSKCVKKCETEKCGGDSSSFPGPSAPPPEAA